MIYLKTSNNTVYSVNGHASIRQVQNYTIYGIPSSYLSYAIRQNIPAQAIKLLFYANNRNTIPIHQLKYISFDGITWQEILSVVDIATESVYQGSFYTFSLDILALPFRLGSLYTSSTQFGLGSVSITTSGNIPSYVKIYYYAPTVYYPLNNDLYDFAGSVLSFTSSARSYNRVSYLANTPIFDDGLYLDQSFDDSTQIPFSNLSSHSVVLQIKQTKYPTRWTAGGTGGNLLLSGQANGSSTTDMKGYLGTLSITTTSGEYYEGSSGFKLVCSESGNAPINTSTRISVSGNQYYCGSFYAKSNTSKNIYAEIQWYDSEGSYISSIIGSRSAANSFTRFYVLGKAPSNAASAMLSVRLESAVANDILYADALKFEAVGSSNLNIFANSDNKLYLDFDNSLLKWTDGTNTISVSFDKSQYFNKKLFTIILIHSTSKTLACQYEGGSWKTTTGALNVSWANAVSLGRFNGSIKNIVQYPYTLTSSEYQNLSFSTLPLRFNDFFITNKTNETIIFENGKLLTETGRDITGFCAGTPPTEGTIEFKQGLAARWKVEAYDTFYP